MVSESFGNIGNGVIKICDTPINDNNDDDGDGGTEAMYMRYTDSSESKCVHK